jgi:hypothetical protein
MNLTYNPCMPSDMCLTLEGHVVVCLIALIVYLIITNDLEARQ